MAKTTTKEPQIAEAENPPKKMNSQEILSELQAEDLENNSLVSTEILTGETTVSFRIDSGEKDLKVKDKHLLKETMKAIDEIGVQMRLVFCRNNTINVVLTGKKEQVVEGTKLVQQKLEAKKKLTFGIEKKFLPQLVGREGKNVLDIMNKTNTKIKVDFDAKSVSIMGSKECVAEAQLQINSFLSSLLKSERTTVQVPQRMHIFFRVAFNEHIIKTFSDEESPLRIHVPPSNKESNEITLVGKAASLEKAKKYILSKVEQIKETYLETEISVPKYTHRFLIQYQIIERVLKETGVLVTIPSVTSHNSDLVFYGEPNKIREAVMMTLSRCEGIVQKKLDVPKWVQKLLKSSQNVEFKAIKANNPTVNVKLDSKTDYIIIEGEVALADVVYGELELLVSEVLRKYVKLSIEIDGKFISSIIGRQGNNINSIKDKTNTYIYIESDEQEQTEENSSHIINIIGPKENAESAKREILEKVNYLSALSSVSIPLPSCYHRFIIGPKGEAVKNIREQLNNEVNFTFDQEKETVTLSGPCHLVRQATEIISQQVDDLSKDRYKQEISIPHSEHQLLFGFKRQFLKEVKDVTNVVSIFLPKQVDKSDKICVIGSETSVLEAIKMIKSKYDSLLQLKRIMLSIPKQYHEHFLHSDAENLRNILKSINISESDVHIEFLDSPENGHVLIAGSNSHLSKLKKALLRSVDDIKDEYYTETIKINHEFHGWIIGKKGSKISQISANHDTKIIFPNQDSEQPDIIKLVGRKENVQEVKKLLSDISNKIQNSATISMEITPVQYNWFTNMKNEKHSSLMTSFSEKHGIIISCYPGSKVKPIKQYKLVASGNKDCMKNCEKELHKILDPIAKYVSSEVSISSDQYKVLVSDRNKLLIKLSSKYNVLIFKTSPFDSVGVPFSNEDDEKTDGIDSTIAKKDSSEPVVGSSSHELIEPDVASSSHELIEPTQSSSTKTSIIPDVLVMKVSGTAKNVQSVIDELKAITPQTTKLSLPMNMHGALIGSKGCNIKSILEGLCVKVNFPSTEIPSEEIEFFGEKKEVELAIQRAQSHLDDIKLKSFSTEITFNKKWLPKIIGRGGSHIDSLKKTYNVTIVIKDRENSRSVDEIKPLSSLENSNTSESPENATSVLLISGYQQNCDASKEAIEKMIAEWESFTVKRIAIPSQFKGKVIGAKWKNINSLSKQYNVSISLAEDEDRESSPLEITGLERDVTACIDRLESIIHCIKEEFEEDGEFLAKHNENPRDIKEDELTKLLSPMIISNSHKKDKKQPDQNGVKYKKALVSNPQITTPDDSAENLENDSSFPALDHSSKKIQNDNRKSKTPKKLNTDANPKKNNQAAH